MSTETDNYDTLPDRLVERLQARENRVAMLTPAADRAIAAAVADHFAPRRRRAATIRRWQYPAAVAAAVAVMALFIVRPYEPASDTTPAMADDVDGSGQVDILDVFALARARNADPGTVSQARIDELAERIVTLGQPEAVL